MLTRMELGFAGATPGGVWQSRGLLAACALLLACSSGRATQSPTSDALDWGRAADTAAPPLGTFTITVLSEPQLLLDMGEQRVIQVQVTDINDAPVAGRRVSFALVGSTQDAGLATLDAPTDANGIATNTLKAGTRAATFNVQISMPGAEDVQLQAAVSSEGWGTLVVSAPYDGKREVVRRLVSVQSGVLCDTPNKFNPLANSEPLFGKNETARFERWPAGLSYAVVGVAEGPSHTVLARGCVDSVRVRAQQETPVAISFTDEALNPMGQFVTRVELSADGPASSLRAVLTDAATGLVQSGGLTGPKIANAEANFLLNALNDTLHSSAYAMRMDVLMLADALASARANNPSSTPAIDLQSRLGGAVTGPLAAIARIGTMAQQSLSKLTVFGSVTLGGSGSKDLFGFQSQRMQAEPTVLGGNPPAVDLTDTSDEPAASARFVPDDDALDVMSVMFKVRLGALASHVLTRVVSAAAEGDQLHPDPFGCMALGSFLADADELGGSACDATCLRDTCDRAIAKISQAASDALTAVDDARPQMRLHGTFALLDETGDLLPDRLSCDEFDGDWLTSAGKTNAASSVSGTASASPP